MKYTKLIQLLTILIIFDQVQAKSRFLKIEECSTSNTSAKINFCTITDGKLNIYYEITKPLNNAQLDMSFQWKSKSSSGQLLKVPSMELCSFLVGMTKSQSPIVKTLLKIVKSMLAEVIKPCPYYGSFKLLNISAESKILNWLPRGTVLFNVLLSNEDDHNIMKLSVVILFEK